MSVDEQMTAAGSHAPDSSPVLPASERTQVHRYKQYQRTSRDELYQVLDAGLVAHIGFVSDAGPMVIPMAYARDGDSLLVHGSTGAGVSRGAVAGAELAVTITILDGLVYAASLYDSTLNYRCATVYGTACGVEEDEKLRALRLISQRLMPGRWDEVRAPTAKELAATCVLRLPLGTASVKIRSGPPEDEPRSGTWTGELPFTVSVGTPRPQPGVDTAVPPSVTGARRLLAEAFRVPPG